jgi:flagellar biosynthesis/type III secretory pathway protein FliH
LSEPVPLPGWRPDPLLSAREQPARFESRHWGQPTTGDFQPWQIRPAPPPPPVDTPAPALPADAALPAAALPADEPEVVAEPPACTAAALEAARSEAFAEGQRTGLAQARKEVEAERSRERALLHSLGAELQGLSHEPQRFFEPLKRLALHLAEQIVRAELQVSGKVIGGLIEQSLAQLDHPHDAAAVVSLHPDDLRRLQGLSHQLHERLSLEADPLLRPGSVRIRVQDAQIEDLIEHRLEALARRLLADPEAWLGQSALLRAEAPPDTTGDSVPEWPTQIVEFGPAKSPAGDDNLVIDAGDCEPDFDADLDADLDADFDTDFGSAAPATDGSLPA